MKMTKKIKIRKGSIFKQLVLGKQDVHVRKTEINSDLYKMNQRPQCET